MASINGLVAWINLTPGRPERWSRRNGGSKRFADAFERSRRFVCLETQAMGGGCGLEVTVSRGLASECSGALQSRMRDRLTRRLLRALVRRRRLSDSNWDQYFRAGLRLAPRQAAFRTGSRRSGLAPCSGANSGFQRARHGCGLFAIGRRSGLAERQTSYSASR